MAPPNPTLVDLMDVKLRAKYPPAGKPKALADLLFSYWNDGANGNNNGKPKGGDALWTHWGGSQKTLADRAFDYWQNRGPT